MLDSPRAAATLPATDHDPRAGTASFERLARDLLEHRLANGWRFLLLPRDGAPAISFHTYVEVGAAHESPGSTGLAHMFEHMAFKGSDRVGTRDWQAERAALEGEERAARALECARRAGAADVAAREREFRRAQAEAVRHVAPEAFSRLLEEAGGAGTLNASTSADETRYVVSLPSERLELWCWLERERFTRPVLREFYQEREAVLEERRMRSESSPHGALYLELLRAAFPNHPYGRPVIGWRADIEAYDRERARAFHRAHYAPNRFTTAIVGRFDARATIELLERYFADLAPGPAAPEIGPREPEPAGQRRVTLPYPATPSLMLAWSVPAHGDPQSPALELAARILGWSRASRLDRRLVHQDAIAAHVGLSLGVPGRRFAHLLLVAVEPAPGVALERCEKAVLEEAARLADAGPLEGELLAARKLARAEILRRMRDNAPLAALLAEGLGKWGDWRAPLARLTALERSTPDEVRAAAARFLVPRRSTVAYLVRPATPQAESARPARAVQPTEGHSC